MWGRGLKYVLKLIESKALSVAPCVGAWVEIPLFLPYAVAQMVAPCVGAWVEICGW